MQHVPVLPYAASLPLATLCRFAMRQSQVMLRFARRNSRWASTHYSLPTLAAASHLIRSHYYHSLPHSCHRSSDVCHTPCRAITCRVLHASLLAGWLSTADMTLRSLYGEQDEISLLITCQPTQQEAHSHTAIR